MEKNYFQTRFLTSCSECDFMPCSIILRTGKLLIIIIFFIWPHLFMFRVGDNSLVSMGKKSVSLTVKLKSSIQETQNYWCVLIVAPIQNKKIIFRKIFFSNQVSGVICLESHVACNMSPVTCH